MEGKWLGFEDDHLLPSSAEIKNEWSHTSTPTYAFTVFGQLHFCSLRFGFMTIALQINLHTEKMVHIRNHSSETKLQSFLAIALWFGYFQPSPNNMMSVFMESLRMYCKWRVNLVLNFFEQNAYKSMACESSGFLSYIVYCFAVLGCYKA